jgi:hypothetical protein
MSITTDIRSQNSINICDTSAKSKLNQTYFGLISEKEDGLMVKKLRLQILCQKDNLSEIFLVV